MVNKLKGNSCVCAARIGGKTIYKIVWRKPHGKTISEIVLPMWFTSCNHTVRQSQRLSCRSGLPPVTHGKTFTGIVLPPLVLPDEASKTISLIVLPSYLPDNLGDCLTALFNCLTFPQIVLPMDFIVLLVVDNLFYCLTRLKSARQSAKLS